MVLGSSLGLDVTMTPGGNTDHPYWHSPTAVWSSDNNMAQVTSQTPGIGIA